MKRKIILSLFIMAVMLAFCAPAMADVKFTVNGKSLGQPVVMVNDNAMVPLSVIASISGADVTADYDQNIKIVKNDTKLSMKVGHTEADLNGKPVIAPVAPQVSNGALVVPLRFVCDALNIAIEWNEQTQNINLQYAEQREGMSPRDILEKCTAATEEKNSYKMKGNAQVSVNMMGTSTDVNETFDGAISQDPLLMTMKLRMDVPDNAQALEQQNMEMVMNDQGMFMKMPDGVWVKMDMPGIDYKALMEKQGGFQDTQSMLEQIKDYGIILVFNDDQTIDGKPYWVISATIGPDAFRQIFQTSMSQLSSSLSQESSENGQSLQQMMNDMLNSVNADIVETIWIDQSNYLIKAIDGDINMSLEMQIPAGEATESPGPINMKMREKIAYEISDYGVKVTSPDTSKAISFTDYINAKAGATESSSSK